MGSDRPRHRGRGRPETRYCTSCGESLEPSMNFCPGCGAATGRPNRGSRSPPTSDSSVDSRPRTDASFGGARRPERDRLEDRIAAASRNGWRLERDGGDHAVMIRRTVGGVRGHLLVALVTVWWTMGIGNVLYGAYRYVDGAERMVVRADRADGDGTAPDDGTVRSKPLRRTTAVVGWALAVISAAVGAQLGTPIGTLALIGLAVVFAVAGTSALPSVSRRLEARRSVLTNGRTRSVDERTVVAAEKPCAACAGPVGRGLERTYRSELCALGVPVTVSEGRNYYCRQCANAESSATGATDRTAITEPRADGSSTESNPDRESESNRESESDRA